VKGAKPSTLRDHRSLVAEPGQTYRRGSGTSRGQIMAALGDSPAREVTTREIEDLLRSIASSGVAPRTINKSRQLVCAIFNYGSRPSTYGLPANPAQHADRRREPDAASLAFYSPEQIETLASALVACAHRDPSRPALGSDEIVARAREHAQDSELIRVAAYAGRRRGELVVLRWRDVDFAGKKLIVRRALSGEIEVRSTKSPPGPASRPSGHRARAPETDVVTSRDRMTTCSQAGSGGASTRRRCGAASSAHETLPASSRFGSMTSDTRTARSSSPAASTCQA
jgi:integrase